MQQQEGFGWRLLRDPSRMRFSVLLAGDRWAIELRESEWLSLVPLVVELMSGFQKVLEIGTGEGQIIRALKEVSINSVGIDQSANQIRHGKKSDPSSVLVRSLAEQLPFRDSFFDAAIACLVVEHVELFEESL